jgi:predicted phosphodiesterase
VKLAVLSDIHGNLPALQAVLEEVAREHVDAIVNLGDSLSGPLLPAETADFLMARDFVTIRGNHERQLLAQWELPGAERDLGNVDGWSASCIAPHHAHWLGRLPPTRWIGEDVFLVHGTPGKDLKYLMETVMPDYGLHGSPGVRAASLGEIADRLADGEEDCRRASLVLCGHSHVPRMALVGEQLVLNPGSVGLQAYEDDHPAYHQVRNGTPHARYAVVERRGAGWHARLCSAAYDWDAMQALAASRGHDDWAYALATGTMPEAGRTITDMEPHAPHFVSSLPPEGASAALRRLGGG